MKPVNKLSFWKHRIDNAPKPRYSVYISSDEDWNRLNKAHKEILTPYREKKVLDAGCGYGRWASFFENYTGVDFSPDFIAQAEEMYPNKQFIQADLKDLPLEDNEFDMAFCVSIKEMIIGNLGGAEWEKMERELKRVAKEVLILEYTEPEKYEII